jgi:hypothetical protein
MMLSREPCMMLSREPCMMLSGEPCMMLSREHPVTSVVAGVHPMPKLLYKVRRRQSSLTAACSRHPANSSCAQNCPLKHTCVGQKLQVIGLHVQFHNEQTLCSSTAAYMRFRSALPHFTVSVQLCQQHSAHWLFTAMRKLMQICTLSAHTVQRNEHHRSTSAEALACMPQVL